jgi:hypothetical protein
MVEECVIRKLGMNLYSEHVGRPRNHLCVIVLLEGYATVVLDTSDAIFS